MNSDQKIKCDEYRDLMWSYQEKLNAFTLQQAEVDNNLIYARGKLSDLNDQLSNKKKSLVVAQIGGAIRGPFGKVAGASVVLDLEREIQQLEREIERVKSDIDENEAIKRKIPGEIKHYKDLIRRVVQWRRDLGCP